MCYNRIFFATVDTDALSILYVLSFFGAMHPNMKYTLCKSLFFISIFEIQVVKEERRKRKKKKKTQLIEHLNFLSKIGSLLSFHWS